MKGDYYLSFEKEKINEKIKLENEEPLFIINYNPSIYSLRYTFPLYLIFSIYFVTFSFSEYYNPNILSLILLFFIISIVYYIALKYYEKAKNYYIIFTNKRIILIENENIRSIENSYINNIEIAQSLYEKIKKLYTIKIYTHTFLLNKSVSLTIELPLLKKEDMIKIREIILNNIEISQSLYERINKLYTIKIYTHTFLLNKSVSLTIELPLLKKEDMIKIREIILNNIPKKPEQEKPAP